MYFEMMTNNEKEQIKKLCYDCKIYATMEAEAKAKKEETKTAIKTILDKYGYNANETIDIYKIDYKEQEKTVADTDKMKAEGIYDKYSKKQITKPLTIR